MIKVSKQLDSIEILFAKATNTRANSLFYLQSAMYFMVCSACAMGTVVQMMNGKIGLALLTTGTCIISGIASWRYLTKSVKAERMVIKKDFITIVTTGTSKSESQYAVGEITNFKYTGFIAAIDHPLKSESFDYIGVETQMKVTNVVNDEGNLVFNYRGNEVRFGSGIHSWDAEEIDKCLQEMETGLFIKDLPAEIPEAEWQEQTAND